MTTIPQTSPSGSRTPQRIPWLSSLKDKGVNFPVSQPVRDPRPQHRRPQMCLMLTHMFGNIWWHSFVRGSGPPVSGCHFRLLRFIPDVLYVGMLPKWSDDLLDLSSDTCALLNLATCHKRTSQDTYGLVVRHPPLECP